MNGDNLSVKCLAANLTTRVQFPAEVLGNIVAFRTVLGPSQPPTHFMQEALSLDRCRQLEHEAGHSLSVHLHDLLIRHCKEHTVV